ncbi:hypothetical protein [Polaromonas sp.]|jgi:hypothetical protein|uniref:hypothetical protein n=1 Tax=Polaromonas sp. TaxID=1869339 RepID=UPI002D09E0F9|nr:hypothetical protein [Polaromonas sp.]HQS30231.1 hypothetical protein [Polaromonas sp.]HQS89628.1 hypothetical protein [Polaromonas sp.]
MTALKIALLGAHGSGASSLARHLSTALDERGIQAQIVLARAITPDMRMPDFSLVFLLGLGRPAAASGPALPMADASIRAALQHTQTPYRVIYGSDAQRLAQVLMAVDAISPADADDPTEPDAARHTSAATWSCEHCSDPACERKLLTDLLAQRQGLRLDAPAPA